MSFIKERDKQIVRRIERNGRRFEITAGSRIKQSEDFYKAAFDFTHPALNFRKYSRENRPEIDFRYFDYLNF